MSGCVIENMARPPETGFCIFQTALNEGADVGEKFLFLPLNSFASALFSGYCKPVFAQVCIVD
ncbi:hypothetical protein BG910_03310 [Neisseria chenwenguii]|uniref:Uncharacterized protein n=1 Tax=Neisseria chenwenguii TaxID=1853278 RepID=A0A220S095_9NEIS|nr:hypothetical protein BG910_03310 [Neisseria chenwenguii]ROV56695.1 hypothetical protein EGS38_03310 [Neisseria chenwenguii]